MDWHELMQRAVADAEIALQPLVRLGFRRKERKVSPGNNARYDGWHLLYSRGIVEVRVAYYEWELEILLRREDIATTYLFLDVNVRNNASGFQGSMFSPDKLADIVPRIARDLVENYREVLLGDEAAWQRISALRQELEARAKAELQAELRQGSIIRPAMEAFSLRDYARVVEMLEPIEDELTKVQRLKLAYARKKQHGRPPSARRSSKVENLSVDEAFQLVENLDFPEGLQRKFAPQHSLLHINREGEILSVERFKESPTEAEELAALKKHPGCFQIGGRPGAWESVDALRQRIRRVIRYFAK